MLFDNLKLKINRSFLGRHKDRKIKIQGFTVFYNDTRSLYSEFKNIFLNKIYHFESDSKNPIIIDGGGHIGLATLYFKKIYPESKITVFEPDTTVLQILKKNIDTNNLKNITICPLGLSSQEAEVSLENSGTDGAKVGNSNSENRIKLVKLSNYINSEIDFLKLNIEGEETAVLKDLAGAGKISMIKEMCIEWHSFANQNQNLSELLLILEENNYKYLINHFDYRTNKVLRPPFSVKNKTQYYLLIYAKKKDLI